MNIVFDASIFEIPLTGIGKTTLFMYDACKKMIPEIKFIGIHKNELDGLFPSFIQFQKNNGFWDKKILKEFVNKINNQSFAHFPWNGPIPADLSIPAAMTLHDVLPLEIPGFFGRNPVLKWKYKHKIQTSISRSKVVFTDSTYSQKKIIEYFKCAFEPIVNYFGPTITVLKPKTQSSEILHDYFLYVGGYDARKGILPMLETYYDLTTQGKIKSKLIMTGTAYCFSDVFGKLIKKCVSAGFVEERGYVSDTQLVELYQNAKALVYLSKYEGFGMPPLEAMHVGCPVITTKKSSLPEICGDAVIYVDSDKKEEIAIALQALESSTETRMRMLEKGFKQASKFSWEKCAEKFLKTIIK